MRNACRPFTVFSIALAFAPLFVASHALAQAAGEAVHDLDIKQGERELDFKAGTNKKKGEQRETKAIIGLGYGVTPYWFAQVSAEYKREAGEGTGFDAFEWENRFRFTEPGRFPLDIGLIAEIDRPRDRNEGYQIKFGPLFQTEIDKIQLNVNLLFQRHVRETPSRPTEMGYQWQAKYRWRPNVQFGLQGFGAVGEWRDWAPRSEQSHRLGPVVFGAVSFGGKKQFNYNAAYLTDPSSRARSHGFRTQLEYKF